MKYMDRVRVLTDDYVEFGIHKGDEGQTRCSINNH